MPPALPFSLSLSSQVFNVWVLPRASGNWLLPFGAVWQRSLDPASLQIWLGLCSHPRCFCRQNGNPQLQLEFLVVMPTSPSLLGFFRPGYQIPEQVALTLLSLCTTPGRRASRRTGLGTAVYICVSPCLIRLHLCVAILTVSMGTSP